MAAIVGGHERSTGGRRACATDELFRTQPRAYEAIAHELLVQILGGHLGPGTRLPRRGSSQPASGSAGRLREALGALEARGVVVTRVGSGPSSPSGTRSSRRRPSADDSPAEFMETRLVLEVAVARLSPLRAAVRRDGLEELRLSVEASSGSRIRRRPGQLDRDFHRGIVGLTGNEHLIALLEPMWETMRYTTLGRRSWSPEHTQRTAVEHRAIYEALRAGDPELAAFAMERHLRALIAALFEDEAFDPPPASSPRIHHVPRHRWDRPADHGDGLWPRPFWYRATSRAARRRTHSPTPGTARSSPTPWPWSSPTRSARASTSSPNGDYHSTPISAAGRGCTWSSVRASRPGRRSAASDEVHPPGRLLAEVFGAGGCRLSSGGYRAGRSSSTSCGGSRRPAPTSP